MSIRGWWFNRSASRATRPTHRIAARKSAKRSVRTNQPPRRFQGEPGGNRVGDFDDIGLPSLPAHPDGSRAPLESSSQSVGDNPPKTVQKNPNNP